MKWTLEELAKHINISVSVRELADALTTMGHEVESVSEACSFEGIVVAHVVDAQPHPQADRLRLCTVDDGSGQPRTIVCGAPNAEKGMYALLAREGAVIPSTGQPLKKGSIRGVVSEGMLCSAEELCVNMPCEKGTIIRLDQPYSPGTPARDVLPATVTVIDVSLTPNRGDCWSVRGIARDLAACSLGELKPLPTLPAISWNNTIALKLEVPAYFTLSELQLGGIPAISPWKQALEDVGQRSMHPIVDLTNYAALTLGQPMHAFDADRLQGALVLRMAREGETFTALDGNTYELSPDILVLADDAGVQSLPGVMGGLHSAVTDATKRVYLEAAWFEPDVIARTGQKLRITTESRTRFERGVDPAGVIAALQWAVDACSSWAKIVGSTQQGSLPPAKAPIAWDAGLVHQHLGAEVPEVESLLKRLGCAVQGSHVTPPSWRYDLNVPIDLVGEIARLHGYHAIANVSLPPRTPTFNTQTEDAVHRALTARGLFEIMTWSMTGTPEAELLGGGVPLLEPLTQDMAVMRASLMTGLLAAAARNQARHDLPIALYEWAHVYHPKEQSMLAGLRAGPHASAHWQKPRVELDFFDAKADVWAVLESLNIQPGMFQVEPTAPVWYHPHQCCTLKKGPRVLGYIGALHPRVVEHFGLKGNVVGFELVSSILNDFKRAPSRQLPSAYPSVVRDFCFVMPQHHRVDDILQHMNKLESVTRVDVVDVYRMSEAERSVSFQVTLQLQERTLTEADIEQTYASIISTVGEKWGIQLRG